MKKLIFVLLFVFLSFNIGAFETPEPADGITVKKVEGVVCTIPKGELVWSVLISPISFEDQYVNVVEIWSKEGYDKDVIVFSLKGFKNDCPIHGLEVLEHDIAAFSQFRKENCKGLD